MSTPTGPTPTPRPAASASLKRPLLHPTNVRFLVMIVLIAVVVFATSVCSQSAIVKNIIGSPALTRLPDDIAQTRKDIEDLKAAQAALKTELGGAVARVGQQVAAVDGKLNRLMAMELRVVYSHDPTVQAEPDPARLEALRALVAAGAEIRVSFRPVNAEGPLRVTDCVAVTVDENGGVLCAGPILAANVSLPDGRRYQETVRHDGTVIFAHWDAGGGNVQGARELARYAVTWLARGPLQ